jgi:Tol biopolymer transport system component
MEPGQTLGHYTIVEQLGVGGMGEVYRARDNTLGRDVALKILPAAFAADAARVARFQREAKLLASLSHPNIAAIHSVAQDGDVIGLALELVIGDDLTVHLENGTMSLDKTLAYAEQIAAAVEAAHEQGVVHRDLKPANIKIAQDGVVKVLDFGLAKATDAAGESASSMNTTISPSLASAPLTLDGVILGTAAYMSPEQARGSNLDRRTDIFSFGVVLFEMLVGQRPFGGPTMSDMMAAILKEEPDLETLPADTPPAIRLLLKRCLAKDPKQRLRDMGEARLIIAAVRGGDPTASVVLGERKIATAGRRPAGREMAAWVLTVVAIAALGATAWISATRGTTATRAPEIRASINAPDDHDFEVNGNHSGALSLSPDGTKMTFSASTGSGRPSLFLRALGSSTAQKLSNTEGATYPFWSPDGKQIAFFADGKLKKLDLNGGAPMTLTSALDGRGGTWNRDGTILFAPETQSPIHRVSTGGVLGGPVTTIDNTRMAETTHRFPSFLPDGRHFLYLRGSHAANNQDAVNSIWVGDLESEETFELMKSGTQANYAQGHLFWVKDQFLMARPFSTQDLEFTGEAFAVGEGVVVQLGAWRAAYAVSEAGPLSFQGGLAAEQILTLFDREGKVLGTIGDAARYSEIRLSRDNRYLAAGIDSEGGGQSDIWVYDLSRNVGSRLTFDDARDTKPVWSPDGKRIAFTSNRGGRSGVFVRNADGRGDAEPLFAIDGQCEVQDWSRDGKYLAIDSGIGKNDLWILNLEDGESFALVSSEFDEGYSRFSPDGKWIGYISNEAGKYELYLTRFPSGEGKWQLSKDGADWLLGWNDAGTELFYLDLEGNLISVKLAFGDQVVADLPTVLFSTRAGNAWDNKSDGSSFVLGAPNDAGDDFPVTLIINWDRGGQTD